jgi:hypothetical protein
VTETLDDILEHHGVKGMKWGVRRASESGGSSGGHSGPSKREVKKVAKLDKKWQKNIYTTKGATAVHNEMARSVNAKMDAFNAKPKWKNVDLSKDNKLTQDYISAFNQLTERETAKAIEKVHGKSPSGKFVATYVNGPNGQEIVIKDAGVKHAAVDEMVELRFELEVSGGKIVGLKQVPVDFKQSDEDYPAEDVLIHYGIKGMRWGVRRRHSDSDPGSADAEKAKQHAATVKTHGTKALSNKELQELVTRMNLEQQFNTLSTKEKKATAGKGKEVFKQVFAAGKTVNDVIAFVNSPAGKLVRKHLTREVASAG